MGKAVVGANEDLLIWDIKKSEIVDRWNDPANRALVATIVRSPVDRDLFAVGYEDGKIRIWDSQTSSVIIAFNGHKSAVTQLRFDRTGARLASGSKDTDIIFWDLVAETGLFKLRGHKDQITSLGFISVADNSRDGGPFGSGAANSFPKGEDTNEETYLISTSKDSLIKIWDLTSQHCIETHIAQSNGECWGLAMFPDGNGCITSGNNGELKAWALNTAVLHISSENHDETRERVLQDRGTFYRQGKDRTTGMLFNSQRGLLAVHGSEKMVELWRVKTDSEIQKTLARKRKRRREKDSESQDLNRKLEAPEAANGSEPVANELFVPYTIVRTTGKVRSIDWASSKSKNSASILVHTSNNQLEMFDVILTEHQETPDHNRSVSVDQPGHRSDIRCLALSSDDRMLASASHGSLKIWNVRTQSCIRTLECENALCITFLPGDKIVIVGSRSGNLEVFDIASSTLLETVEAHEKDIWSLQVHPDGKSMVSVSADKCAKFWEFKVVQEEVLGTARSQPKLTLVHIRTLKVTDDILCARYSPDGRLLALSTLDNTIKVFFSDSLRLFLTLYGHKLPALSLDISYDSKLIVSSSADKNIRVWGLDFGDCHKTFFAHQDSILSVAFVPSNDEGNGHHFFSASKDSLIKYFDGDKFETIQKLDRHHSEVLAIAISHVGDFLVSSSHDKSIRLWQQTDEQIFLEEEREKELEEMYESTLLTTLEQDDEHNQGDGEQQELVAAGRQTVQTLMAGEKIVEALEMGMEDVTHPIFVTNNDVTASAYVLGVFRKIPPASLHDALLVLSFSQLPALFTFLAIWASDESDIPLTCRVLMFIIKTHQKQLVSNKLMKVIVEGVRDVLRSALMRQKDELGFNLAGTRILQRRLVDIKESAYVDLADTDVLLKSLRKMRTFINFA